VAELTGHLIVAGDLRNKNDGRNNVGSFPERRIHTSPDCCFVAMDYGWDS